MARKLVRFKLCIVYLRIFARYRGSLLETLNSHSELSGCIMYLLLLSQLIYWLFISVALCCVSHTTKVHNYTQNSHMQNLIRFVPLCRISLPQHPDTGSSVCVGLIYTTSCCRTKITFPPHMSLSTQNETLMMS
jgi:hypothetical protein